MKNCDHTVSNITCQRWDLSTPHEPFHKPYDVKDKHNYCRNPDDDTRGPWCYTTDPKKRWEYCNLTTCTSPTEIPSTVSTIGIETSTILETSRMNELTNYTVQFDESNRQSNPTIGLWYLYVIGAVALIILLTVVVLIVIIKRKRGKGANRDVVIETGTISLYEDVPEQTLQRTRENTYTEIPFFAGYLTGYDNLTASESSGRDESVVSGSTDDTAVYQNVVNGRPAIYESSEAGTSPKKNDHIQDVTYETPTSAISEDLHNRSSRNGWSYTRQISTKQDDKRKSPDECNQGNVMNDADCAVYRIPVLLKPINDEEGYEIPCVRRKDPVHPVASVKKLPQSDSTPKMDAAIVCISPKLIDHECEYEEAGETDVYSTPTSPVFPMERNGERGYNFNTENDYASVEPNAVTPNEAKDEYCTMDKTAEQRKDSDKVVTLSRTYVTMHSANAPKSLKELKKQAKLHSGNKRKTK